MIDELAKAMAKAEGWKWELAPDHIPEGYLTLARAVLTRLREPTPGMVEAGLAAYTNIHDIWRAMIDAAMEEGK